MQDFLRSLSPRVEFVVVIGGAFGLFVLASVVQALVQPRLDTSDDELRSLLTYEVILLAVLGTFLHIRGWTTSLLGLDLHPRDFLLGAVLAVAVYAVEFAGSLIAQLIFPLKKPPTLVYPSITVLNFLVASVINPIFEEVFLCGYVVSALQKSRGPWAAINVSTAIRLLCHLYQGAFGVLSIVPTGLIFAYWFARTRRLWPPIVAHGLLNFIELLLA
jgi:membrane protease YdiL (CAAX protease family)